MLYLPHIISIVGRAWLHSVIQHKEDEISLEFSQLILGVDKKSFLTVVFDVLSSQLRTCEPAMFVILQYMHTSVHTNKICVLNISYFQGFRKSI